MYSGGGSAAGTPWTEHWEAAGGAGRTATAAGGTAMHRTHRTAASKEILNV